MEVCVIDLALIDAWLAAWYGCEAIHVSVTALMADTEDLRGYLGAEPSSQGNWKHVRRCIRHGDHSCTTLKFCDGLVQTTQVSAWCPMQVMATTALSVGDSFPMSKGGAFKLEIPMLLSLCVSVQRLSVFGSHWLDLLILVRSTLKLWNLSELEQVRLDVIMVWI